MDYDRNQINMRTFYESVSQYIFDICAIYSGIIAVCQSIATNFRAN